MLEKVRRTGAPILITRRGEPIAEVTPPSPEHAREDWLGSVAATARVHHLTLVTADARLWRRPDGYTVLRA